MAEDMVERVAAAIGAVDIEPDARWSELTDAEKTELARAAIAALRDGSDAPEER